MLSLFREKSPNSTFHASVFTEPNDDKQRLASICDSDDSTKSINGDESWSENEESSCDDATESIDGESTFDDWRILEDIASVFERLTTKGITTYKNGSGEFDDWSILEDMASVYEYLTTKDITIESEKNHSDEETQQTEPTKMNKGKGKIQKSILRRTLNVGEEAPVESIEFPLSKNEFGICVDGPDSRHVPSVKDDASDKIENKRDSDCVGAPFDTQATSTIRTSKSTSTAHSVVPERWKVSRVLENDQKPQSRTMDQYHARTTQGTKDLAAVVIKDNKPFCDSKQHMESLKDYFNGSKSSSLKRFLTKFKTSADPATAVSGQASNIVKSKKRRNTKIYVTTFSNGTKEWTELSIGRQDKGTI